MHQVPLSVLRELCDPLKTPPWPGKGKLRDCFPQLIKMCIEGQVLADQPVPLSAPLHKHAARVAFLVLQDTPFDPIEIDVGVPGPGHTPKWIVEDGNHRLCAALYRNDATISAEVGGSIKHAEHLKLIKKPRIKPR